MLVRACRRLSLIWVETPRMHHAVGVTDQPEVWTIVLGSDRKQQIYAECAQDTKNGSQSKSDIQKGK